MKLLFELFPVLLFFAAYKIHGIYIATAVMIITSLLQAFYLWRRDGSIPTMHWVTLGLVVLFGGLTLLLQDPTFVKIKPTIVNWLFAGAFLVAPFFGGKTLLQRMMEANVELPESSWKSLNVAWILFFAVLGGLNVAVAFNFSEDAWVNFKLYGLMGLTFLFALAQGFYIARHLQNTETVNPGETSSQTDEA
ncbi:MAG: septation protein A [Pseudomonadota bacterium]